MGDRATAFDDGQAKGSRCDILKPHSRNSPYRLANSKNRERRDPSLAHTKMALMERIQKDLTAAMMAKDELRLSVLRMVKSALRKLQRN